MIKLLKFDVVAGPAIQNFGWKLIELFGFVQIVNLRRRPQ